MNKKDLRWQQRFSNYSKALKQLEKFMQRGLDLNDLEKQGLIKSFEYNYELAWDTLKDFYEYQGEADIQGSRDAFQIAFKRGLIVDGDVWMEMLKDRNRTVHSYNEETVNAISLAIRNKYFTAFAQLHKALSDQINA